MEQKKTKPPSAPLAASYLLQHKCIYVAENRDRMCGDPVSPDHNHYCQVHAQAEMIRNMLMSFAAQTPTELPGRKEEKLVVVTAGSPGWW